MENNHRVFVWYVLSSVFLLLACKPLSIGNKSGVTFGTNTTIVAKNLSIKNIFTINSDNARVSIQCKKLMVTEPSTIHVTGNTNVQVNIICSKLKLNAPLTFTFANGVSSATINLSSGKTVCKKSTEIQLNTGNASNRVVIKTSGMEMPEHPRN